MKHSALRKLVSGTVGALCVASGLLVSQPASAAPSDEGGDPSKGCQVGSYALGSYYLHNWVYNQNQGLVEIMYSPSCGTNWVNLYGYAAGNEYYAYVKKVGGTEYRAYVNGVGSAHSRQTYAPGAICIGVRGYLYDLHSTAQEGSMAPVTLC